MDLTGQFPLLEGADSLYTLKEYSEKMAAALAPLTGQFALTNNNQALATNAKTAISWNQYEGDAGYTSGTYPDRIYAPKAGLYRVEATVLLSNVGGGFRSICLRDKNGRDAELANSPVPSSQFFNAVSGASKIRLEAGDYFQFMAEVLSPSSPVSAISAGGDLSTWLAKYSATRLFISWERP